MLGFLSAHIPFNAITNRELRRAFLALRSDIRLPSASTLGNLCHKEYDLTLAAIKSQLPKDNKVSLALDGWTSCNRLAIESVIGYYIDNDWKLREVQLAFDEVAILGVRDFLSLADFQT
jgi:hypothetical protein